MQDPERLLRGSTALRRAYGNRLSNEQVLDIAMKASEGSPSQATALLSASAGSAAFARMAGIGEKQLLTANAINASIMDTSGGAVKGRHGGPLSSLNRNRIAWRRGLRWEFCSRGVFADDR